MRAYTPKHDVQKKSYFSDRFYVTPRLPRKSVYDDSAFSNDFLSINNHIDIQSVYLELDHLVLNIKHEDNYETVKYARDILAYDMLVELSAIDYVASRDGFEIFYEMLSTTKKKRLRIKTFITKTQAIESVESLFKMANWSEREMYDMFGIAVNNHSMLKRILMPDDWHGNPLLKTYPLHGDEVAQWYEVDKIFGKEARDIIGPENRDPAAIDRYDTKRFSRLGHETPNGTEIGPDNEPLNDGKFQEEGGVRLFGIRLVTPFDEIETKHLEKRK